MISESLITNTEYNTKMNKNISILSDIESILPEDLSYAITINTSNEDLPLKNNKLNSISNNVSNNNYFILKLNILILFASIIILCILFI